MKRTLHHDERSRRRSPAAHSPDIMRSATITNPPETLGFRHAAPHNNALRIINLMQCST